MWEMQFFSFENHAENEAGRLVPDLFLVFKKAFYKVKKQVVSTLVFIYFGRPPLGHKTNVKTIPTVDLGKCKI